MVEEIFELIRKTGIECEQFDENEKLETYIKDSYRHVKLIVGIEKKFHIEIPEAIVMDDSLSIRQLADEIKKIADRGIENE